MQESVSSETTFDHWCLVELMGHQTVAGKVTEANLFGAALMRVDIPATANGRPGYTKYYGASAIYAITPMEEEAVLILANVYDVRPVDEWRLRSALPAPQHASNPEMEALRQALHDVQRLATDAQGEWLPVDASQAPEWTLPLKEIASDIEAVLSQEEFVSEANDDTGF